MQGIINGEIMKNKKIMIIEDDKEFLDELKDMLESSGYDLVGIDDPAAAIEVANEIKPSVILLDLKMPKINGFQLANELRYFSELTGVPIIAMSAYYKDGYDPLLDICGIKRCLTKPFQPLDVIAEIEEAMAEYEKKSG